MAHISLLALALAAQQPQLETAAPPVTVEQVEAAIATGERQSAMDLAYRLAEQRQDSDGANRSDSELAYLFGKLHLSGGNPQSAIPYLRRADGEALGAPRRAAALIALADALEAVGDRGGALAAIGRLDALSLSPRQQVEAVVRRARLILSTDPVAALALVEPLTRGGDPGGRFHGLMIAAQAHGLVGNRPAAQQAGELAWSAAPSAPPGDYAAVRAGLLLAALGRASQPALSLLSSVRGDTPLLAETMIHALPVCGETGIRPEDEVTFVVFVDENGTHHLSPVTAARSSIVPAFLDAFGGRRILAGEFVVGRGSVVSLRCRTQPSQSFPGPVERAEPLTELLAARNIFIASGHRWDADRVQQLERRIAALEARHGRMHPLLIGPVSELSERSVEQMVREGAIGEIVRADLPQRVTELLRALPGGSELLPAAEDEALNASISATPSAQQIRLLRDLAAGFVERLPLNRAYEYGIGWLDGDRELGPSERQRALETLLRRFQGLSDDPRRKSLLMRLGRSQFEQGNPAAAQASFRQAGLPGESCLSLPETPAAVQQSISSGDYPLSALRFGIAGTSVVEHSIDPDGQVTNQRPLISSPPGLFEDIARQSLGAFRFSIPQRNGRPMTCTGRVQRVMWRLPEDGEPQPLFQNPMPLPFDT